MFVSVRRTINELAFGFRAAHINIRKSRGKTVVGSYEMVIRYPEFLADNNYFEFSAVKEVVCRKYFVAVNSAVREVFEREFFDSRHRYVFEVQTALENAAFKSLYAFGEYDFRYYAVIHESRVLNVADGFYAVFAVVILA